MLLPPLIAMVACDTPPAAFTDVLPDERLILHEEELVPRGIAEEPAEWATWLLDEARATNRRHTELVLLIESVTVLPARYLDRDEEHTVVWGPWIVDDEAERLTIEDRGDRYAWAIERQIVDPERIRFDDEAWVGDLVGEIAASGDEATGGAFVIDVDEVGFGVIGRAADVLDDGDAATGEAPVDTAPMGLAGLRYTTSPRGGTLTTFPDLDEGTRRVPTEGGLTFAHEPGRGGTASGTVRIEGRAEALEVHVQWDAEGGGRADVSTGGATQTECWGPDHGRTFASGGEGTEANCLFGPAP